MTEPTKLKLIKKILEREGLPSLSAVTVKLVDLAADDRSSADDLAEVIRQDPALATRLIKLAGSVFFSGTGQIASISQAIVRMGFTRVRMMALSLSLLDTFSLNEKSRLDYTVFWKSSLGRAMIAQDLIQRLPQSPVTGEEAFLGALIQEIGLLMLFESLSDEDKSSFPEQFMPLERMLEWETGRLGVNHREIGSLVLKRWHFPEDLVTCQRRWGQAAFQDDSPFLAKILEVSRRASEILFGPRTDIYKVLKIARRVLGLKPPVVQECLSEVFAKVERFGQELDMRFDSQKDILRVMDRANKALSRINASMENSLQQLLDQAKEFDETFSQLNEEIADNRKKTIQNTLDAVAHEIRNPVLAIGGLAKRLALGDATGQGAQYAKIIAQESNRLERVLKDFTEFAEYNEPVLLERNLGTFIRDILDELKKRIRREDIEFVTNIPDKPVLVSFDPGGLSRVFRHLLKNAVAMIGVEGGRLSISVRPLENTHVEIQISDTGRPAPSDYREALLDENLSSKTFGGGQGLPVVRKIVSVHGGRLEFASAPQTGNTTTIFLPLSQGFDFWDQDRLFQV